MCSLIPDTRPLPHPTTFSPDYASARQRFRDGVGRLGWALESYPLGGHSPDGEPLTVDVAVSSTGNLERTLVLSSGLHGVEGFFGSAVQLAALERWAMHGLPETKCVLLHGLNPYGFAHLRRFNEQNVDPNRNFLLTDESYVGAPTGYAELDSFLNPRRPPSRWEPVTLKALWLIARHGLPSLRQAIAAGQYDYSQGLFFGGTEPIPLVGLLADQLPRWLTGSQQVVHLDFHTGLGRWATCKLLLDYAPTDLQLQQLSTWFGPESFEANTSSSIAYDARGGFGRWCLAQEIAPQYLFACAEFGTYGPVPVLAGLRAENQAHHWGDAKSPVTQWTKRRLKELFCPASAKWRSQVVDHGMTLIKQAVTGMREGG